jgi:hypothetical protein
MVEPMSGWLTFLAIIAIIALIFCLTFSNFDGTKRPDTRRFRN